MKIINELEKLGLELTEEQKKAVTKKFSEDVITNFEHEKKIEKAEAERDSWKERCETAEETLKGFEGKDFDTITRERDEWKKKAEDAEKDFTAREAEREKQELLKEAFADIEFTSESAKKAIVSQIAESISVKNGKLIGFNDLLEEARKNDESAFASKKDDVKITSGLGNNTGNKHIATKKDIDAIKDTRDRQRAIAESIARGDGIYQQ